MAPPQAHVDLQRRASAWGGPWEHRASQVFHAHLAAADVRPDEPGLERVGRGRALEALLGDGGEPEAVLIGKVVAGPPASIALNERCGAEVLQTAARRHQRLAATFVTCGRVLCRGGDRAGL